MGAILLPASVSPKMLALVYCVLVFGLSIPIWLISAGWEMNCVPEIRLGP